MYFHIAELGRRSFAPNAAVRFGMPVDKRAIDLWWDGDLSLSSSSVKVHKKGRSY